MTVLREPESLALYGGSFDPVHLAHLVLAQDALEAAGLDVVYFVPAAQNPHKKQAPAAAAKHRLAMLKAATAGDSRLAVLDIELERDGPSYALQTVRAVRRSFTSARLCWILGADQLDGLPRWWKVEELVHEVEFLCLGRPGSELEGVLENVREALPGLNLKVVPGHLLAISSTEIRERLQDGRGARHLVPEAVHAYMEAHDLYR